jgi:hypothetical protein
MNRKIIAALALVPLAACVSTPQGYFYEVKSGLRVDANPALLTKFQQDRAICDGEAAKSGLGSTEQDRFTYSKNVNLVFDGCLAQHGYVRKP